MKICLQDINAIKLYSNYHNEEYFKSKGEHYKLLAYLSTQVNNSIIFDIGTHRGYSALALSYNNKNTVHTFDLEEKINNEQKKTLWINDNVIFNKDNLMDHATRDLWKEKLLSSSIIFLDIDPHEGSEEYKFYLWLKDNNYNGLLILDDIYIILKI